jgi:hypothetical protein
MGTPDPADDADTDSDSARRSPGASQVRAAQLRARAIRSGLVRVAFGTVFLVGALAHALSPQRHDASSRLWMTGLFLSSTLNVAFGLRTISRARATIVRPGRAPSAPAGAMIWIYAAGAWAVLGLAVLGLLLRR